jgi:CRP-like cAMP-binding protein
VSLINQSESGNWLLQTLAESDFGLLQPHLRRTDLKVRDNLYEPDQPIEHVHFLEAGVASIVSAQEGGEQIEIGLYGRDGMSGSAVVLGAGQSPHGSMMQVDGATSLRIHSDRLADACDESRSLRNLLLRYVQTLALQAAQTAAANAHYALPERLARWLLMCHDRVEGDEIPLTHEFMAMMLGVRRSGVTVTLHTLEATGAIRARRGLIVVTDRDRLEEIAGDSYGEAETEYRRLIGPFGENRA